MKFHRLSLYLVSIAEFAKNQPEHPRDCFDRGSSTAQVALDAGIQHARLVRRTTCRIFSGKGNPICWPLEFAPDVGDWYQMRNPWMSALAPLLEVCVQPVSATPLVVYRLAFGSPRFFAGVD
jgi:hypothetical protein